MGMKMPRGKAQPVGGATSKAKDVTCYEQGVWGANTKARPKGLEEEVGNTAMPKTKDTGTPKIY